jgi:ABC-2 type transport system permease protein
MSNILAIAHKELKNYFATPIGYVLVGFFTLLFGWFFYTMLWYFERQSMQMASMGMMGEAPTMNVNEQLIRPAFMNVSVILLLTMPLITMRLYSEEKRSGTIELLLTSPLTDFQIVIGKFLGSMALYAIMLSVTLLHIAILYVYGNPEWRPIAAGYLGLLLMGGCFVAVGLFISSMTRNQIVAAMATFGVFLLLWVINWIAPSITNPTVQAVVNYLSFTDHLNDFVSGVVDTAHLCYYVSFIAFGLFLTARSVDSERWRG